MNDLILIQPDGNRAPVTLRVFIRGAMGYVMIGEQLALTSPSIAKLVVELRLAADILAAQASRGESDQLVRAVLKNVRLPRYDTFDADGLPENIKPASCPSQITMADLRSPDPYSNVLGRADAEHNIRMLALRFPWLYARDVDHKEAEKIAEEALQQPDQLAADLALVEPLLDRIVVGDKINKSEIARTLGLRPTSATNSTRVQAVVKVLEQWAA
jgi:hypothetical protein